MTTDPTTSNQPIDAVAERLNDPGVAASLVTLLDNAELLSTLVLGLAGFVERSETVMDSLADSVHEFKAIKFSSGDDGMPTLADARRIAGQLGQAAPVLEQVLQSPMTRPETISLLSLLSESAVEGSTNAQSNPARLTGIRSLAKAIRDPEVLKGLGVLIEISKSLGRRLG